MAASPLYHYTCEHHIDAIRAARELRPGVDGLVWLTDLAEPIRAGLGLTSHLLQCDRTAHRVIVPDGTMHAIRWVHVRTGYDRRWAELLESAPGALPMHWWVAMAPVPVMRSW